MSPWRLRQIAQRLMHGAVIAYPSDTIWGFGCHPLSTQAVSRIQAIKRRPAKKSMILLGSSLEQARPFIDSNVMNAHHQALAQSYSRPRTWIIKASPSCPHWLQADTGTIAFRLTDKPQIQALCETINAPLISTSANISGRPTARNSLLVHRYFQLQLDYIIEGFQCGKTQASEIRDIQSGKILRA